MAILKNSLLTAFANGNIFVKNFQHVFRHLGIMRVSYYFDIGKFFYTKIFHGPKTKFGKIIFWAYNFFLTLAFKSVNSNSSSFGKTVKRPINYFSRLLAQMAILGISQFLGPKSKISLLTAFANGNIFVKNFQHVFQQLGQIRVSYYLDIGNFFTQKNFTAQKRKFGKIYFWA